MRKYVAVAAISAGIALVVSAAALAFEGGIIADETASVGSMTPVEVLMWGIGAIGLLLGVAILLLKPKEHEQDTRSSIEH